MRERSNNVGMVAGVALALWLGACSGDGQSNGTVPQDVITAPDVASDSAAPEVGPDTVDPGDTAASDTEPQPDAIEGPDTVEPADTVEPGWDVGVVLPTPPVGPACAKDADCSAPTGRCDPLYHVCVECVVGTECGWNRECKDYHCEGPGGQRCLYDWDCLGSPDGHVCKPLESVCTRCYEDWHCAADEVCEDNVCVPGTWQPWCDTSLDCPADKVCNEFHCVECAGNEDCADGQWCLQFECVNLPPPEPEPPVANLLGCESDKDCRDYDALCNKAGGFCALDPSLCQTDDQCPTGYKCRGHVCRPLRCHPDEGMCFNLCRDFSNCRARAPQLLKCADDGSRFLSYDELVPCYVLGPNATTECIYGAGAYEASCGPRDTTLQGSICRDAYTSYIPTFSLKSCACNEDLGSDRCVYVPILR